MRSTKKKQRFVCGLGVLVLSVLAFTTIVPSVSAEAYEHAKTKHVDCDRGETVNRVLRFVDPGDTILINGTCNENLLFSSPTGRYDGVTLDGQGAATISGPDSTLNVIEVTGVSRFTIRGLTITGGHDGLSINTGHEIAIDSVVVENTGRHGIHFQRGTTMAFVVNSTIQNNPQNGIVINENSYVRVGFTDGIGATEGDTGPCLIQGNGSYGVRIQRASSARIYMNTISNNANNGINIESASYAEVATNAISGNGKNGVAVTENSTLHLGNPAGNKNEDRPNTSTAPNAGFGLSASWGAYVVGRMGTLMGSGGASNFTHAANNNLTP